MHVQREHTNLVRKSDMEQRNCRGGNGGWIWSNVLYYEHMCMYEYWIKYFKNYHDKT